MTNQITVRRYYFNSNGRAVDQRDAPFEDVAAAIRYLDMLRGTIKRQGDNSMACLMVNGQTIKVDGLDADPRRLAKALREEGDQK